jgi:hypothetical protein
MTRVGSNISRKQARRMRMNSVRQDIRMQFLQQRIAELQEENLNRRKENLRLRIQSARNMLRVRQAMGLRQKSADSTKE